MRLSAQEEYGLRCLLQVAIHDRDEQTATSASIAAAEGLSNEYVAKLMRVLRQGGLVTSSRGAVGGYKLARPASEIDLMMVIEALDGPLFQDSFCDSHAGQQHSCVHSPTACSIRTVWRWVGGALDKVLRKVTIADLVGGPRIVNDAIGAAAPRVAAGGAR